MPWERLARALVAVSSAALLAVVAGPGHAGAQTAPTTVPPPPLPASWILVDADTGAILGGANEHLPQPPASTIKIVTALMAAERLPADAPIPISPLAEGMPARKINVKAGQTWDREDLLYSMLLVSANDAAVALAEQMGGGSLDGWVPLAEATAERLGMTDAPVLNDPSGLDDEFSHNGGSLISAHDLAIAGRAFLARPDLMAVAGTPQYLFHGGDGLDHELNNHDTFLSLYPGATGLKTGLTDKAGRCLVATATRDGRTMLVVLFDAVDIYASATQLLDQGFATPVSAEVRLAHLPDVVPDASLPGPPSTASSLAVAGVDSTTVTSAAASSTGEASSAGGGWNSAQIAAPLLVIGVAPLLIVLRRRSARRGAAEVAVGEE